MEKIITEETLWHGWEAVFKNYQKGDIVGRGATAELAKADLLEQAEG